jgi:hypothetical protein
MVLQVTLMVLQVTLMVLQETLMVLQACERRCSLAEATWCYRGITKSYKSVTSVLQ